MASELVITCVVDCVSQNQVDPSTRIDTHLEHDHEQDHIYDDGMTVGSEDIQ